MKIDPIKVRPFSPNSPNKISPKKIAPTSMVKPITPIRRKFIVLWFLYPRARAKILIGNVHNKINLWINSFSRKENKNPEEKIKREGVRKQWATQTADKVIASLSEVNCAFIISFIKNLKTHVNYGFWDYKL